MCDKYDWLPPKIEFSIYKGDWFRYLEDVYLVYLKTLVWDRAAFQEKTVYTIAEPKRDDKEDTFWHIVEGKGEDKTETDFGRYACIPWVRKVIESNIPGDIAWWIEKRTKVGKRRGIERLHITLRDFSYIVVLNVLGNRYLLITAYPIKSEWDRKKYKKRFDRWKK